MLLLNTLSNKNTKTLNAIVVGGYLRIQLGAKNVSETQPREHRKEKLAEITHNAKVPIRIVL